MRMVEQRRHRSTRGPHYRCGQGKRLWVMNVIQPWIVEQFVEKPYFDQALEYLDRANHRFEKNSSDQ